MLKCWDKWPIAFSHHFELSGHSYTSTLDHFFLSESISRDIKEADVLHLPSNTSDHCPIYCSINTKMLPSKCRTPMQQKPKANWDKASDEQRVNYIATLENNLRMESIPTSRQHCQDVHCHNANHHYESDDQINSRKVISVISRKVR